MNGKLVKGMRRAAKQYNKPTTYHPVALGCVVLRGWARFFTSYIPGLGLPRLVKWFGHQRITRTMWLPTGQVISQGYRRSYRNMKATYKRRVAARKNMRQIFARAK